MDALLRRRAMIAAGGGSPQPVIEPVFYDYLVFDGTAYILTPKWEVQNPSFVADLGDETTKAAQRLFMALPQLTGVTLSSSTTSTTRAFSFYYGSSSSKNAAQRLAFSTARYSLWMTPKRVGVNASTASITMTAVTLSSGIYIGYSTSLSGQRYTGKMGIFKIYGADAQDVSSLSGFDSYTPVYTLRPCTYNGEAGMWCPETSTFYGNSAGAGSFSVMNNE